MWLPPTRFTGQRRHLPLKLHSMILPIFHHLSTPSVSRTWIEMLSSNASTPSRQPIHCQWQLHPHWCQCQQTKLCATFIRRFHNHHPYNHVTHPMLWKWNHIGPQKNSIASQDTAIFVITNALYVCLSIAVDFRFLWKHTHLFQWHRAVHWLITPSTNIWKLFTST